MVKNRGKKSFRVIGMGGVAGLLILAFSFVPLSQSAFAADDINNCFESEDHYDSLDEPYRSQNDMLPIKASCSMKLYYMDISFSGIDSAKGLETANHASIWHDQINSITIAGEKELRITWNEDEDDPQTEDGRPYIDVEPNEALFGYWYTPLDTVFKKNLPITINEVRYDLGDGIKTAKNIVLDSVLTVTPDRSKEVLMISGVEDQEVTYTGEPVVLAGDLKVEENTDGITADDLTVKYFESDGTTEISRPTNPGSYVVEYSFENDNFRANSKTLFKIKDYNNVDARVENNEGGRIIAPQYVDKGGNLHVEFVPDDGYELLYVEHNDDDITDLLVNNGYDVTVGDEPIHIYAVFRPVYDVTDGDGGEYIKGSGNTLSFKIDKDPSSYTDGIVTVNVDDRYLSVEGECNVDPESQTVTLSNEILESLSLGEHKFEINFFDTSRNGVARAVFTVVEPSEEDGTNEEATPTVPDTGSKVKNEGSGVAVVEPVVLSVIIAMLFAMIIRRAARRA